TASFQIRSVRVLTEEPWRGFGKGLLITESSRQKSPRSPQPVDEYGSFQVASHKAGSLLTSNAPRGSNEPPGRPRQPRSARHGWLPDWASSNSAALKRHGTTRKAHSSTHYLFSRGRVVGPRRTTTREGAASTGSNRSSIKRSSLRSGPRKTRRIVAVLGSAVILLSRRAS